MKSKLVMLLGLFFAATVVWAQAISTSQIRGTVVDESGAAVAGADVKLTQTATSAVRSTTSGTDGSYVFAAVPVGSYQLEVSKQGFTKYLQTGIVLQVGVSPTLDVTLKVGALTQQVVVEAQAAMVETQATGFGQVTAPEQVQNLPLNGRQLTDLLYLSAGVAQGRAFRASYPSSAVPSIAGGTQGSVAYWLDGGTHNDPLSNQNLPLPFPDTVEEFKVETSSLPAQYGTHPSGAVNVVTKSGSNAFHGDVFEYVRNFALDAKNTAYALPPSQAYTRDDLKRNQFGGTVGGPIEKDKLFFFLGWQDTIQRSTVPNSTTLPTAAMLAGNFQPCLGKTAVLTAPGSPYGGPGPGANQTNPANFSPIIMTLEKYLPVTPDVPGNSCGTYYFHSPVNFGENQGVGRVDYHASNRNTMFARYFITDWEQQPGHPETLPSGKPDLLIAAIDGQSNRVQNLTIGDTYLFGSNMVNTFHATGNRSRNLTVQNSTLDLADLFTQAGVPAAQIGSIYQLGPPKFPKYMAGFQPATGFYGLFNSTPSLQPYDTIEAADDLSLTRGAHQLSFGGDFINLRAFATNYLFNQGTFTFDGNRTHIGPPLPSLGLADFLLGWTSATSGFAQDAPIPSIQHQNVFALYAQDAWKITRRLTVTAGIRWDPFFGHTDPKGHVVTISIPGIINDVHSQVYKTAPSPPPAGYLFSGDPGGPSGNKLTRNALDKWSPRIGLAWDPKGDGRMSIRAGFGIFYDFPNFSYDQFGFEEPWGGAATAPGGSCTTECLSDPWGSTGLAQAPTPFAFIDGNGPHVGNPFPGHVGQGPNSVNEAYLPGALVFSYPQNIKPTYMMQYNLSIEKQVGASWVFSATYIGNQQRHLWGNNEANPGLQGPCPGAYPNGYPLPSGVTCTAPGGGGTTVEGACALAGPPLSTFPPGVCGGVAAPFALNANRLFYHFNFGHPVFLGSVCAVAGTPNASCYGETLVLEEGGTGNYNGLVLSAQHRFAHHFTSKTNYTWSHCISDNYTTTLGFFLATESVPYDRPADRGNCPSADTHNVFNQSLVTETPKFSNRTADILAGHWKFSLSAIVQSGTDISPILVVDFSGSGNGLTQRPSLVGNPYCQPKGRNCWLNPASFVPPANYTFGNLRNNSLFGPGSIIVNTALSRLFQIREGQTVEFRWEVFNLPNHANLYPPQGAYVAPTFGQPTPASVTGLGALAQTTNDPRIMQFALKYVF